MKKSVCLGIFLLINTVVFSNDSSVVLGESVEIIDNESTNITMLEEEIIITLYKGYYEVDVTFDFFNDGPSEDILLGFPVFSGTYDNPEERKWAQIDFESYINGNLLTDYTVREKSEKNNYYLNTTKWYIREVTFPQNSHTYSRVIYRAPYSVAGYHRYASYIFGTGRCWKGSIGKMTIYINHGDDVIIDGIAIDYWKDIPVKYICEASGRYKFVLENVEPEEKESIRIGNKSFDIYGEYKGGFGDPYVGWMWNEHLLYKDITELKFLTLNQIRLFIGFFYANYGYDFKNPLYKYYFQRLSPSWFTSDMAYKAAPEFTTEMLNEFERKNVNYLLNLERITPFEGSEWTEEPYPVPVNEENINFQFKVKLRINLPYNTEDQTEKPNPVIEDKKNEEPNTYKNAGEKRTTIRYILLLEIIIFLMIVLIIGVLVIKKKI